MKTINLFVARRNNPDNTKENNEQKELLMAQSLESDERFKEVSINLFVACPQKTSKLREQKEFIKKKCLESNTNSAKEFYENYESNKDSAKEKSIVNIKPLTYDDPERREEVSKKIIKHRADIVVFLFDKDYDECLLDELKLAVEQSIIFHKPEPLVYIQEEHIANDNDSVENGNPNQKKDDEFKKVREVLAEGGWIYEPFEDTEDLWNKVKDKIDRYAHSYDSIREIRKWSKMRYYGLPIAIVLALIGIAYFACRPLLRNKVESRQLLIMGGGSAINYIVEHTPSLRSKYDLNTMRWHYAAMASGNAYGLIAEEVIKNYHGYKSHPYYPIVLSAKKASEDCFLKTSNNKDEFNDKGIVIGIYLGYDWLVAYGSKDAFPKPDSIIHADVLNTIIADQVLLLKSRLDSEATDSIKSNALHTIRSTTIYTTSDNSGTLDAYKAICDSSIILYNDIEHHIFSDIVTLSEQKHGNEWIALGSKYYHPLDTSNVVSKTLHDSIDQIIQKPIYIYFMLYKQDEEYVLPRATKRFLKKIRLPVTIIDSLDNPKVISNIRNDSIILYDNIFKNHNQKNE